MSKKNIAIEVKDLYKSFHLPTEQASGIKQAVINRAKGIKGYKKQEVLHGISFDVEKGDFLGIVGRNGSGKSTLLKLISQIYNPDSGSITINGSLVSFIELGVGFNPELTGRENVYLNGAMLGFDKKEVDAMYDEIVDFAELEDFMDQKLKNYSSGMQVRLAFSCAIRAKSDILILDEVLAVGDEAFQRKCMNYFAELKKDKKTVILVTHSMSSVQQYCTKALMIEKGEIVESGDPAEVAQKYRELFINEKERAKRDAEGVKNKNFDIKVSNLKYTLETVKFKFEVVSHSDIDDAYFALAIVRNTGEMVYRWSSNEKEGDKGVVNFKKNKKIELECEVQNIFPNGIFSLMLNIRSMDGAKLYISAKDLESFEVINRTSHPADIYWKPSEKVKILK